MTLNEIKQLPNTNRLSSFLKLRTLQHQFILSFKLKAFILIFFNFNRKIYLMLLNFVQLNSIDKNECDFSYVTHQYKIYINTAKLCQNRVFQNKVTLFLHFFLAETPF